MNLNNHRRRARANRELLAELSAMSADAPPEPLDEPWDDLWNDIRDELRDNLRNEPHNRLPWTKPKEMDAFRREFSPEPEPAGIR